MLHDEFGWRTDDGLKIFAQVWIPEHEIKAVVCLVHGLGEHSGRYKQLPVDLTNSGFALIGYDQRGHGKSEGKRGHTPSYEAYLADISKVLHEAGKRYPDKKIFLYGHSMGGNLVINYALRNPSGNISGVIATGPWLKLSRPLGPIMNSLAVFLNKCFPSFSTFHGIKSTDFSQAKYKIEDHVKDELMHPWISARTFICIRDAGLWALEHASEFKFPLLILHGGSDKVTSPESSREFVSRVKTDCTLKIFDELYHEIHNEPKRDEIFSVFIYWLNSHTN
jgi:alpha-beta hydrolase superfamily lysophospholipase